MSSDNQFTALGPAVVGFRTDDANSQIGAQISGNTVEIKGSCQGSVGEGAQGTGNFSGVGGFGGANSGTGVIGFGGGAGTGGRGIGSGAPNTAPAGPAGVYRQGGNGAPGVIGQGRFGIADGVQGFAIGNFSGCSAWMVR